MHSLVSLKHLSTYTVAKNFECHLSSTTNFLYLSLYNAVQIQEITSEVARNHYFYFNVAAKFLSSTCPGATETKKNINVLKRIIGQNFDRTWLQLALFHLYQNFTC